MNSNMEHMSVWELVSQASLLVQLVMLTLVLASIISWYLIVGRTMAMRRNVKAASRMLRQFRQSAQPDELYRSLSRSGTRVRGLESIFCQGYHEYLQLRGQEGVEPEAVAASVERALLVAISDQEERLERGLSWLATIGSVSPYVGLFGTVWGIMNAFMGLSQVEQATLSAVAPGIAEALIATAIGLFAAIPAVMAYNRFSAQAQLLLGRYYGFANELQARLLRSMHLAGKPIPASTQP